ncbi:MAG: aminotransferase class V-fold PLP-dependent enzyme [Bacteroidota bacterium]
MNKIYFTPGPSALYFSVEQHIKYAIKHGITSISHRSKKFEAIFKEAEERSRSLLNLPDNYKLVFTSSATEIWEKMTDSLIEEKSLHMVNGAFSKKFYSVARNLGKDARQIEAEWGKLPDYKTVTDNHYEVIGVTHNETSTGVVTPLENIYQLKENNPESLVVIDAVSSLPIVNIDFAKVDSVYASVQKAFGLPAGLGAWFINDKTEAKARLMKEKGLLRDTYHNILSFIDQAENYQTPSTPNVLGIFLFSQVIQDMLNKGMKQIRNDSVYKSAIMYNMLDQHDVLRPFVKEQVLRSETIIVVDSGDRTNDLIKYLSNHKMIVGGGYGKMKGKQIRIANFPTHSREQFEMLTDLIEKFE